eukprot:scaffold7214_cov114-Isochrysis_galbana.AAC.9
MHGRARAVAPVAPVQVGDEALDGPFAHALALPLLLPLGPLLLQLDAGHVPPRQLEQRVGRELARQQPLAQLRVLRVAQVEGELPVLRAECGCGAPA